MTGGLAWALALSLALCGFAALALSMDRHGQQVWRAPPSGRRRAVLRVLGVAGLGAALAACVADAGVGVGIVQWLGVLTAAALAVALALTYCPRAFAAAWRRPS